MVKVKIVLCNVLVFFLLCILSAPLAQAQVLDDTWFVAKFNMSSVSFERYGAIAVPVKEKASHLFYFKFTNNGGSDCGGFEYDMAFVIVQDSTATQLPDASFITCNNDESLGFLRFSDIIFGDQTMFEAFLAIADGTKMKSLACILDNDANDFNSIITQVSIKCKWKAKKVDVTDLPFNPADFGL